MILKSYIVENKISTLDTYKSAIFYGENIGLKDDIKHKIVEQNNFLKPKNKQVFQTKEQTSLQNQRTNKSYLENT